MVLNLRSMKKSWVAKTHLFSHGWPKCEIIKFIFIGNWRKSSRGNSYHLCIPFYTCSMGCCFTFALISNCFAIMKRRVEHFSIHKTLNIIRWKQWEKVNQHFSCVVAIQKIEKSHQKHVNVEGPCKCHHALFHL